MSHLRLKSSELEVVIDATYGADILSIKTTDKAHEVLLQTPWADRAEAVIKGEQRSIYLEPQAHWM
jgi:hypothetical protein